MRIDKYKLCEKVDFQSFVLNGIEILICKINRSDRKVFFFVVAYLIGLLKLGRTQRRKKFTY